MEEWPVLGLPSPPHHTSLLQSSPIPVTIISNIGDHRFRINPPSSVITPIASIAPSSSFQAYVHHLPQWEKDLLTHIEWAYEPFEIFQVLQSINLVDSMLIVASDGAATDVHGMSFGIIIGTSCGKVLVKAMGRAIGEPHAHRAESIGILAGAHCGTIYHSIPGFNIPQSVVKVINALNRRLQYDRVYYANATLATDWDILEEVHTTYQSSWHGEYEFVIWARGSTPDTDDEACSTIMSDYISLADTLAYECRQTCLRTTPDSKIKLMPSAGCILYLDGKSTTSAYRENVRRWASQNAVLRYLENRHGWSTQTTMEID